MILPRPVTMQQRLLRLLQMAIVLAVACVGLAVVIYEAETFKPRTLSRLQNDASVLEEVVSAALDFRLKEAAELGLARHCANRPILIAALYTTNSLFATYLPQGTTVALPVVPEKSGHQFHRRSLSLWWPVHNNEDQVIGHLYLVQTLPPLHSRLPQYGIMIAAIVLVLWVIWVVLMRGLRQYFLRPLSALLDTTNRITERNDYSIRAAIESRDELGQLATAFNRMLETVAQRDAALREAGARIQNVFNATTEVGIVATDLEGRVTAFNTGAERLFGHAAADVIGRAILSDLHTPGEVSARAAELSRQTGRNVDEFDALVLPARNGDFSAREWTMRRKNGTQFTAHLTVTAIRDTDDDVTGFLGVVNDITDRKRAEELLRESERNYREVFNATSDAIFIHEMPDGRLMDVNDAMLKMFRFNTRDEALHCPPGNLIANETPYTMAEVMAHMRKTVEEGPQVFDWKARRNDGDPFWAEVALRRSSIGGRDCVLASVREVTERKKAEEKLRRSEERFRSLIENASDIVSVLNAQGVYRFQSPSAQRLIGYAPEDLVGKCSFDYIHPDDIPGVVEFMREAMAHPGTTLKVTYRFRHHDGSWRMFESLGRCLPGEAEDGYIIINSRDITESSKLEEQLRQSQKMEAIGQLAGGVAHDFNNILTIIQGNVALMNDHPDQTPELRDSSDEIGRAAQRAANLTRQLLTFSRRQTLQMADIDLTEIVAGSTSMLKRILGEDLSMHLHYAPHPVLIHADIGMIEQILLNLAVNARDAMPKGGRLIIETSVTEFDENTASQMPQARPGHHACLTVSDTGCGIKPENLPRIFDPFFTTKDVGKGTGLGLATVYGIVQQHHGWIHVYSVVDKGTTFRIYWPRLFTASSRKAAATSPSAGRAGHETILLVEDEPALRTLVRNVLTRMGYRVLDVPNGVKAMEIWETHHAEISLLLTDLVMPDGMSGIDLAGRVHQRRPDLPVIFTSGYSAETAGKEFPLKDGVNFLAKPFGPRQLSNIVRKQLDRH